MRRLLGLIASAVLVASAGCCLHNTCDCCGDICGSCHGCAYGAPVNGHIAPVPVNGHVTPAPMPNGGEPIKVAPMPK